MHRSSNVNWVRGTQVWVKSERKKNKSERLWWVSLWSKRDRKDRTTARGCHGSGLTHAHTRLRRRPALVFLTQSHKPKGTPYNETTNKHSLSISLFFSVVVSFLKHSTCLTTKSFYLSVSRFSLSAQAAAFKRPLQRCPDMLLASTPLREPVGSWQGQRSDLLSPPPPPPHISLRPLSCLTSFSRFPPHPLYFCFVFSIMVKSFFAVFLESISCCDW